MVEARAFNFNDVKAPEDNDFKAAGKLLSNEAFAPPVVKPEQATADDNKTKTAPEQGRDKTDTAVLTNPEKDKTPTILPNPEKDKTPAILPNPEKDKASEKHLPDLKIVDKDGKPVKHALDKGHFSLAPGQCVEGIGSHYGRGDNTYGRRTASGEIFRAGKATVALPNFNNQKEKPFDVTVQDMRTGKMIEARVNDMGPHKRLNRVVDIESATFKRLLGDSGLAHVRVCRPSDKYSRNSHTLPGIIEL